MLPTVRQKNMLDWLSGRDMATINELIQEFGISIETVRRDLNTLEKLGKVEKVYGGARLATNPYSEPAIQNRMQTRQALKTQIAQRAAAEIEEGDCIFLDSGSTPYYLAKALKHKQLTVVTNSLWVVNELMDSPYEIIIIGGRVRHSEHSVTSYDGLFNFDQLNIHKCFISCGGISAENGVSDYHLGEIITRRAIMGRSKRTYALCDSSKIGQDVTIKVCDLSAITQIITDDHILVQQQRLLGKWLKGLKGL